MKGLFQRVFIIAEAGVNHNGRIDLARKLIDAAKHAGADAVKFQSFSADLVASIRAPKAGYQKQTTKATESQLEMLRKLELSKADHLELIRYCRKKQIEFISSPFDMPSIDLLKVLKVRFIKIPSGELTNVPYLEKVAKLNKPTILSTGMADMDEVGMAVRVLQREGVGSLSLLHCVTEYPTPVDQVNLRAMDALAKKFGLPVGYSDHTVGNEVVFAAVGRGAKIIEKHFTLNKKMTGPDHKASANPKELAEMVRGIRAIELALGTGEKKPAPCEMPNRAIMRKSLVASRDLTAGEKLTLNDILIKRPGNGIPPKDFRKVIGRRLKKSVLKDELFKWGHLS